MSDYGTDLEPDPVLPFADEVDLPPFLREGAGIGGFQNRDIPAETPEDTFNDAMSEDVSGLIHIGYLTGRFEVLGHSFVLRTLKMGEELAVGQIVDEYAGTVVQAQAFATALVAASIVTVDGRHLMQALGPDEGNAIRDRFEYITKNWHWGTVDAIYTAYQTLVERQIKAYQKVQDLSKASRQPSTP